MRGRIFSTDDRLPEQDLFELVDLLACQVFQRFGERTYALSRRDIAELVAPFIDDLAVEDRREMPWMVWDLLQEGLAIEYA